MHCLIYNFYIHIRLYQVVVTAASAPPLPIVLFDNNNNNDFIKEQGHIELMAAGLFAGLHYQVNEIICQTCSFIQVASIE